MNKVKVGEVFTNNKGEEVKVVDAQKKGRVLVEFLDTGFNKDVRVDHLLSGAFSDNSKQKLEGNVYSTPRWGDFTVIEDITNSDKRIRFNLTGYERVVKVSNILKGQVKDNTLPTVFGVGWMGEGEYDSKHPAYRVWLSMLRRCYVLSKDASNKSYIEKEVKVSPEWHDYQNFAFWFDTFCKTRGINYEDGVYDLDKDILGSGLVYKAGSCCIVPRELNQFYKYISTSRGWKANKSKSKPYSVSLGGKWIADCETKKECMLIYGKCKQKELEYLYEIYSKNTDESVWEVFRKTLHERYIL